jgi:hypothetical protein
MESEYERHGTHTSPVGSLAEIGQEIYDNELQPLTYAERVKIQLDESKEKMDYWTKRWREKTRELQTVIKPPK